MIDVLVTGIGVVSAFGIGREPFWKGIVRGESALRPISRFPAPEGALGGEVLGLEIRAFARTALARRIDRASLLALAACRLALQDSGVDLAAAPPERTGMSLGSALGNLGETATFLDRLFSRGSANPLVFPNLVMNAPLSYASIELGVTGPTAFLTEQEASGEAAIAWGASMIAEGRVDICLAGGGDELDAVLHEVLREGRALAQGEPLPFDPDSGGPCPGEGAAVLVLESRAHARARNAYVYARLVPHPGFAVPAPVHGWPTDAAGVAAGLAPLVDDADLIIGAASGQPALDRLELAALRQALGPRAAGIVAPRAAVGDFGAAGALGAAAAALAIARGVVPRAYYLGDRSDRWPAGLLSARDQRLRAVVVSGLARGGACQPLRLVQG